MNFPLFEFDELSESIIQPSMFINPITIAPHCVPCFFQEVLDEGCNRWGGKVIWEMKSELGTHRFFEFQIDGKKIVAYNPGLGAPMAVILMEAAIALGCKSFIACGSAGSLPPGLPLGHFVVATSAARDEGTSYHYLPASRYVTASAAGIAALETTLNEANIAFCSGKTWTTDAFFRETRERIRRRVTEGCLVVDMEAAAMFALGQHRSVDIAQLLYAGDLIGTTRWEARNWMAAAHVRRHAFELSAKACLKL